VTVEGATSPVSELHDGIGSEWLAFTSRTFGRSDVFGSDRSRSSVGRERTRSLDPRNADLLNFPTLLHGHFIGLAAVCTAHMRFSTAALIRWAKFGLPFSI